MLGINAYQSSWPVIGAPTNGYGGNSIYGNSPYNINFTSGGSLYAQYTYWGGGDPSGTFYTSPGSYINSNNWNPSDPWQGISLPKREDMPIAELPERTTEEGSLLQSKITQGKDINALQGDDNLFDGSNIRREHGNNAAKDFFKSYITKHSDNQAAYIELYKCYDEETAEDIIQYFSNLPPKAAKEHSLLLAYLYLRQGNVEVAKKTNNNIIKKNPNSALAARAKLNNAYIALYNEDNFDGAVSIFMAVLFMDGR